MDASDWRKTENKRFIDALLALKNREELERFLRDLLTKEEIEEFAMRFQVAELLEADVPYSQIQKLTGLSSTTIARVSKWLKGDGGGYRTAIEHLHAHIKPSRGRALR